MQNGYASSLPNLLGNAALVLKEGLRGIRYITLSARYFWGEIFKSFPEAIRRPIFTIVGRFDDLAEKVDRRTSSAAHYYLDPEIARDSDTGTFTKIIERNDASVVFAKTTYDSLKLIVRYSSLAMEIEEKFFISEMLSACAYRKSVGRFADLHQDRDKAGLLAASLMRQGVIRTHTSYNAAKSQNENISKLAKVSCFANMLWLVIARDYIPEREEDLLYACCDLSLVIAGQIEEAGDDPEKLGALLKSHAEII